MEEGAHKIGASAAAPIIARGGKTWESGPSENLVYDVAEVDSPQARRFGRADGMERNLYVSARDLTRWGELHLRHGELAGRSVLPREVFGWVTSVQSPPSLPWDRPHHGFSWWINDNKAPQSELGARLPASRTFGHLAIW